MCVILQAHHSKDCNQYPVKCQLCESDVPRHYVSVNELLTKCLVAEMVDSRNR